MEKKYYIIPTIKVKEMETGNLMDDATVSIEWDNSGSKIGDQEGDEVLSKPMYGDFNVWEK